MNILASIPAAIGGPFLSHILTSFPFFAYKNRISDCKTDNTGGAVPGEPVADMPVAALPTTGVLAIIGWFFYHISRLVFAFLLVQIVFLIIKLVMQG